jgi:hypothetical protein
VGEAAGDAGWRRWRGMWRLTASLRREVEGRQKDEDRNGTGSPIQRDTELRTSELIDG